MWSRKFAGSDVHFAPGALVGLVVMVEAHVDVIRQSSEASSGRNRTFPILLPPMQTRTY